MSNYSDKIQYNWVVNSLSTSGKKTVDLKAFEFAVVNADTHKTVAIGDPELSGQEYYFAVGSPNRAQATDGQKINRHYNSLNSDVSFKSDKIGNVGKLRFVTPDKQDLKQVYYLGYNGLDQCESLEFECGKNYKFHISVQGQNVQNVFGRYEFNEVVSVDTPCCDASCGCVDGKIDCSYVIDDLLARFDSDLFWVKRFYNVEKVINCSPALVQPTKTNYTTYCLTVCDNGDALDLSAIQSQYPTVTVEVKERKAPYTTYQFTQLAAAAAPAAYTQTSTVVRDCTTCPAGFTSVTGGFAYIVEIDNTNADLTPATQLTAVQTIFPTATFASKANFNFGTSTYYVVSSAALTAPTGDARIVKTMGETSAKCQQTTPLTYAWASCGTSYKVTRDLCLTKANADCQTNPEELAEIQAYYAAQSDVVAGSLVLDASSTDCLIRFNISQFNNALLADGCDTFGSDGAKFDSLPTWKGFRWEVCPCEGWTVNVSGCPVPPVPDDKCCQCGLKFTTIQFPENMNECIYDITHYQEKDPVELSVTIYRPDGELLVCGTKSPTFRKTQAAKFQTLKGFDVMKQIIITRNDRQERFMNLTGKDSLLFLERQGTEYGVKLNDYYYEISISSHSSRFENRPLFGGNDTITLYIHESQVVLFESLKGQLSAAFPTAKVETY